MQSVTSDQINKNVISRLASQSDAIARLAQNSGGFSAVFAAFESKDPNAFRWTLEQLDLIPHCEVICDWVRTKLCVLRCIEVCGAPREKVEVPGFAQFARAIVRLASNEKLLRRVVDAVSCGDGRDYRAAIDELGLQEFCYLLCHWVCETIYLPVCEVVCIPEFVPVADAVTNIRAAAKVLESVIERDRTLDTIAEAAVELNCLRLQSTLNASGLASNCEILCGVICTWRCVWVCREVCDFPTPVFPSGIYAVEEARNFALASRQLAGQPRALADLVTAAQNRNAQAYSEIVARFRLEPYCHQLCAWLCSAICHEFCICVCPNTDFNPLFTTVGDFNIYADIDGTTGKTNKSLTPTLNMPWGGGPNFAFFDQLQLGGFCPSTSPTSSGTQMQYRFLYATAETTLAAAITAIQPTLTVASSAGIPATPFTVSVCADGESGETMTVTKVVGNTWTVTRGVDGTTGAAAPLGATLWINPTPITNNLVYQIQAGTRNINWPKNVGGIASSTLVSTAQPVYIVPSPAPVDAAPPAPTSSWALTPHFIGVDPVAGWVPVDLNATGGGFSTLLGFDTTQPGVAPGGDPLPGAAVAIGHPGGVPAGTAVPAASQQVGVDLTIIFQATRVGVTTIDYSNSLCKIHVNNWSEVNNLWFLQFATGCCTPINDSLSVQFTVDHEEMDSGAWSLAITSCSPSAPGVITPPDPTTGVTFTADGRGASGTVPEDTTMWSNCSYTASLSTRPGLTTGLYDYQGNDNLLTFCICGH
ncbi:MAG: hypothetical protein ABSH50_17135 [Bryobacteraceae bacterium]|jgi:hypothetical protein